MEERAVLLRFLSLCCTAALFAAAAGPANSQTKPALRERSAIAERVASPDVQQVKAEFDRLIREGHSDWAAAEALLRQPALGDIGREFLLHDTLLRIRAYEPDADALDFVARMQSYSSEVYVSHEEGPLPVAVYPIAAAAEGTRRLWQRRDIERNVSAAFAAGDMSSLAYLRQPGTDAHAAVLAALRDADASATEQAANWLAANAGDDGLYEARAITALRNGDSQGVSDLLRSGNGAAATRLLREVRRRFDADAAFGILRDATANPSLGSAALFEIDALRSSGLTTDVDGYLLDTLVDPVLGPSAAAIVARRGDHEMLTHVAELLAAPDSTTVQQSRAVLALTLADSPYARRVLEEALRSDSLVDAGLREEVSRWLED